MATPTVTFIGASGVKYTFEVYELSTLDSFNAVQGVYIFTRRRSTQHTALYIGETENAKTRLTTSHEKLPCVQRNNGTHICFMQTSSESKRMAAETDLIRSYSPDCNR